MIDFTDQVVVVSGAGRGLGRLYALDLARRGAAVVVNDLGGTMGGDGADARVADEVVDEIRSTGGTATASYDSVESPAGGEAIVTTALDEFGRLDAVVSNAGIFHTAPFDELTADEWQRMLRVHLDGAFHLSQPAYKVMKSQGFGRFVFIASSAGLFGQPNSADYAAAKAGTMGLANVIAIEGAEHGILANCVLPFGYSRMVWELVGERDEIEPDPGFLHAIEPELVVPMVVYLASRACELTHHNFSACVGRFARVFVGLGDGWVADGPDLTADDLAEHVDEIATSSPFTIPGSIIDEVFGVCERLGIGRVTMDIQELSDRAEILDCMNRYTRGIDRLDRELVRSAYHDGAVDDHIGYSGPVDGFIDWAFEYHATQVRHQHYITNHFAEIVGDEAHTETYYTFIGTEGTAEGPLTVFGGRYVDRLERRDGRWAITVRRCLVEWATSPPSLLPVEGAGLGGTVARDSTDASYERPLTVPPTPESE